MKDCGAKHRCADGRTGECRQVQGHLTRHLCRKCLAFFTAESSGSPESGVTAVQGTHPLLQSFLQMEEAAKSSRAVQGPRIDDGQFRIFGVWKATTTFPYGTLYTELILKPNKDFSQIAVLNGMMAYDVGTIQLGEGFIHFVVRDHEPKEYHGVRIKWLESWTYLFRVQDANTVTFEDRIAHAIWTVHRG